MSRRMVDREQLIRLVVGLARELSPETDFHGAGLNSDLEVELSIGSLERVELVRRMEQAFSERLSDQRILSARTIGDLVEVVAGGQAAPERPLVIHALEGEMPPAPHWARSVPEVLQYLAEAQPHRASLVLLKDDQEEAALSYAELLERVRSFAGGLRARGILPGDRIAIMLPTSLDFFVAFFGTLWAAAVPVPLYPPVRLDQAEEYVKRQGEILKSAGARLLVSFPQVWSLGPVLRPRAPHLEGIVSVESLACEHLAPVPSPDPGDIAFLQYTSGSTGAPKGVVVTHHNLLTNVRSVGEGYKVQPNDVWVTWLPLYHDMGLAGATMVSIYHGMPLVVMGPEQFLGRPARWLRALSDYRGTITAAPNFAYELCTRKVSDEELEGVDLSAFRIALNGAEPVRAETLERFQRRFEPYGFGKRVAFPAYGLAEATVAVAFHRLGEPVAIDRVSRRLLEEKGKALPAREDEARLDLVSCGRPLTGVEVRVIDRRGKALPERRQGHLQVRGGNVTPGYFQNPTETSRVLHEGGWLDTGDLAYLAEGELYLTGRIKDLLVKAGRNIHPSDLEAVVADVEGVRPGCVAAFGIPGKGGTEDLVVVAEARRPDPKAMEPLAEAIRQRVASAAGVVLDHVQVVPPRSVPKTSSGKIRRFACRQQYLDGSLSSRPGLPGQVVRMLVGSAGYWTSRLASTAIGLLRGAYCWAGLFGCAVPILTASWVAGPEAAGHVGSQASRLLLKLIGVRVEVEGPTSQPAPVALVSNHASLLDAVVVAATWQGKPLRFVASHAVATHFFTGALVRALDYVSVVRGESPTQGMVRMRDALETGACLMVFPEGAIEPSPGLRAFATGAFRAAAAAGVPVVPVALEGTRAVLASGTWPPSKGTVRVRFYPPIEPSGSGWEEAVALSQAARERIAQGIGEPLVERRVRRRDPSG